ncbi:MAG: hypothetical protein SOZ83_02385 [Sphaerochaetaceae bacterium]|nr:hypothetical protein [Sphaerochaetaceae bacterium]
MKKGIIIFLLIASLSSVFASDDLSSKGNMQKSSSGNAWGVKGITNVMPNTTSNRIAALGGTGTVLSTGLDSLYLNPANLAKQQKFFIEVPSLNISISPFAKLLKVLKKDMKASDILSVALNDLITKGNNPVLLNADVGVGFAVKGFGFNVFADVGLFAYTPDLAGSAQIFPMVTAGASVGYAHSVFKTKYHRIDVGLSFSFMVRAYSDPYTIDEITSALSSSENITDILIPLNRGAMVGFMHPISVGMTYTFADQLSASVAFNNIWPSQGGMLHFATLTSGISDIWSSGGRKKSDGKASIGALDTASLDVGVAWNPKWKWFNPRVEFDLYDLTHYTEEQTKSFKYFFGAHMRLGIELFVAEFLGLRFGVNGGRLSFGARLDLWPIVIDLTYGWREWGEYAGDSPKDFLSLTVKIGWDRTK